MIKIWIMKQLLVCFWPIYIAVTYLVYGENGKCALSEKSISTRLIGAAVGYIQAKSDFPVLRNLGGNKCR